MRKIIKSVIVFALMTIMSVSIFSACSKTPEGNSGTADNGVKRYEIELTKDNFDEFLEYKITVPGLETVGAEKGTFCEIKGVLNYAYYKDVKITFNLEYANSSVSTDIYKGVFVAKLNAAGNYSFYTNDSAVKSCINSGTATSLRNKTVTITAVSGIVIFDI